MTIPPVQSGEPVLPDTLELGIWAPTLAEQGLAPFLGAHDLEHFQADDVAISRLHVRGLISYSAHIKAREKLGKLIKKAIRAPAKPNPPSLTERGEG